MTSARRRLTLLGGMLTLAGLLATGSGATTQDTGATTSLCTPDTEPNDTPETAPAFATPGCFAGQLPDGDQDLLLFTVTEAQAAQQWDITVDGIDRTITGTKFFVTSSAPGETPLVVGNQVLEVTQAVDAVGPAVASSILLPAGRYLVGISRSTTADGVPPVDIGYQVTIATGAPLPPLAEVEPNDDVTTATNVQGAFAVSGDLRDSQDDYRWTTSELPEGQAWDLRLRGPLTSGAVVTLLDAEGSIVASTYPDALGLAELADLRLPPGVHILNVYPSTSVSTPYSLVATIGDLEGADPEPNSAVAAAVAIDVAKPLVRGRLSAGDTQDWYSLVVDDTLAASLADIRLIWRDGPSRRLCLNDAAGNALQCRTGDRGVSLSGLRLSPGTVTLSVYGDPAAGSTYLLRIDSTTAPADDFEAEPNDDARSASVVLGQAIRGQLATNDYDFFRVTTTGEPQLWQVDVTGTGIGAVRWVKPDGTDLGFGEVTPTGGLLTDLYLIPGEHWLRVDGSDGEYTLALTPLGPPDPNGEREPNNWALNAEPLDIGATRVGRLPITQDADVFRFTVNTADHVRVTLNPPKDGTIDLRLESGALRLGGVRGEPGLPSVYDVVVQPGDYELWLTPSKASTSRYDVTVEREDPFTIAVDQEPNDDIVHARPLPRSLHIAGTAPPSGDTDWFALGSLSAGGDLRLATTGTFYSIGVSDGVTDYAAVPGDAGSYVVTGAPSGVPLWLRLSAFGSYSVDIDPGSTGLAAAVPEPTQLPVTLTLTADAPTVAAYWAAGQLVTGSLAIANDGAADLALTLDWATSDADWTLELGQSEVRLAAGATLDVPVTIRVLPDAAVDGAVRLTVRARDPDGAQQTSELVMAADPDAPPVSPYQAWTVPDALLGGLNVASAAIGGTPVVSIDADAEAQLYDGITTSGRGFWTQMSGTPLTVTVDLAGDAPIPVAGMILNPLGSRQSIEPGPRAVALLLSEDGTNWAEVLTGELSPLTTDQSFVLPEPIRARFAQLRIDSTWAGTVGAVVLGEWKVIARPGAVPDQMPANIADPTRGGHVVWMGPVAAAQTYAQSVLTDDPTEFPYTPTPVIGDSPTMAIGFRDDRAALLTSLEWVDPVPSDPAWRMRHVDVAISTTSPVGPWEPVGTWDLERADDGSVGRFVFEAPTWARFVRLTGDRVKKDSYYIEEPATLRVMEAPTDDTYRSILGEWGLGSPLGPHEWSEPPDLSVAADAQDGDDTPGTARALTPGSSASGRVHRDEDVDWYSVSIPAGQNSLAIAVGGVPAVGVALTLFDIDGQNVPMAFVPGTDGRVVYQANVASGATYRVRVAQPPFSAVFTFDTSGSMGNYLPFVTEALRAYTGGVTKGDEAVKVTPFDEQPLLPDWTDDPYLLQDAVGRYVVGGGSSSAETAVIEASKELAGREGARAVLLVTDAETTSYQKGQELWSALEGVRPMVFAVHVGADSLPEEALHFMQDWAMAGGGFYQYAVSHGEMDQAFERMATWLRRPASYTLDAATSQEEVPPPSPGTLSVVAVDELGAPVRAPASKDLAVEIILDTSGSMLDKFGGKSRIDSARQVLEDLVTEQLPPGAPVAVRILGSKSDTCGTRLLVPLAPLDADEVIGLVDRVKVDRAADTAIGAAFDSVPTDLGQATGIRIVLLITDSKEIWPHRDLCGRDPLDAIRDLKRLGIDARINIVGMAVDDRNARRQMTKWAKLGGGAYFDARDRQELEESIRTAVSAPYQVFDQAGELVGNGTVGGAAVKLPPGTYRVVVLSEPPVTYEGIVIESDESVTVTLPVVRDETEFIRTPSGSPEPGAADPAAP